MTTRVGINGFGRIGRLLARLLIERTGKGEALRLRAIVVRPGLIVGPGDYSDRFTYWPRRIARGGEVMAPGTPSDPVQFIDCRDLAEWYVRLIEDRRIDTFNGTGPRAQMTIGGLLRTCRDATGADAEFVWADTAFLEEHEVGAWMNMPCWIPAEWEYAGFGTRSIDKAVAVGLTFRPLADTVRDTLSWYDDLDAERRRAVGVERDMNLARPLALQVDARDARDARQPRLNVLLDEPLVGRQVLVRIVGQHTDQQGRRAGQIAPAACKYLRLDGVGRPRRHLAEIVDDVELGRLDVGADREAQVDEALAAADERADVGQPGRVLEHVFLWFDDVGFHLFGSRGAPEVGDRHLWFLDGRQQLDRQGCDGAKPEQGDKGHCHCHRRPMPGAHLGDAHKRPPNGVVTGTPRRTLASSGARIPVRCGRAGKRYTYELSI